MMPRESSKDAPFPELAAAAGLPLSAAQTSRSALHVQPCSNKLSEAEPSPEALLLNSSQQLHKLSCTGALGRVFGAAPLHQICQSLWAVLHPAPTPSKDLLHRLCLLTR